MSLPLNYDNVLATLTRAAKPERGTDAEIAESQMKVWQAEKGYHFLLQKVYNDMSQSLQVRWLAVICLKNGVDKYWRPTRMHAIQKDEKQEIRKNLFNQLDESNNQLTIQNAHLVARIARVDFPGEWPGLLDEMAQILESAYGLSETLSVVRINNLLLIMNQVLKMLASVRIGRARGAMQAKMPIVLPHLIKYYHHFFNIWTNSWDPATMEVGYMCLKNIRRAIVDGYDYPHRDHVICEFFETSLQHFQKLLLLHESTQLEMLERYLKCYLKLYFNLVSSNTSAFLLFPCSKSIVLTLLSLLQQKSSTIYNVEEPNGSDFWEQMGVKAMLIMKKVTQYGYRKGATTMRQKSDKAEADRATKLVTEEIFTPTLLQNLVTMLVQWYLKLRPCDLESWRLEPEEWVSEELQMNWEYQIRPCAENYFQDLTTFFKDFISEFIMNQIQQTLSDPNADVLSKDATLTEFQLSSEAISSSCNFDEMLPNYFLPEALRTDSEDCKIIKRRVCRIISDWIDVQYSKATRDQIYKLVVTLLEPNQPANDVVVRLTTLQTLRCLVDDWEFRKADFQVYLDDTLHRMLYLLKELESPESKMFLLKVLSIVIERCNPLMSQNSLKEIVDMVPAMWEESNNANETIIKNSLLRVLRDLTTSLNSNSDLIHPMVMPLIPSCCTDGSQYYSLLCEDAFELWAAVLRQLPIGKPIPDDIYETWFPLIIPGLANWTEILPLVLKIIRSYAIINKSLFETEYGLQIFKLTGQYLSTMRDDALFVASHLIEILTLQLENNNLECPTVANLIESGLFGSMIKFLTREAETANCEIKLTIPILRLILVNPKFFIFQMLSTVISRNENLAMVFNELVKSLLLHLRQTYDSKTRKLFLLALVSLYDQSYFVKQVSRDTSVDLAYQLENMDDNDGVALVLSNNFNSVMTQAALFLEETQENEQGDCPAYHRQSPYDDEDLRICQTEEELRDEGEDPDNEYVAEFRVPDSGERIRYTEILIADDPVYSVNLKKFIQFKISQLTGSVENYNGLVNSLSKETMDDLQLAYSKP